MVRRNTNNLHDSSQQQQHWSSMVPESEGAITHGGRVHHWGKSLNQLITRNSQGDLHMPKIKELFKVKSSWAAWAALRCRELRSSHQFAITFGKWEHEIGDSLFQFKANKIKLFFPGSLEFGPDWKKKEIWKTSAIICRLKWFMTLSIKAFNTNLGGNKQIATAWAAARHHESRWHGAPTVTEEMFSTVCNSFSKVPRDDGTCS